MRCESRSQRKQTKILSHSTSDTTRLRCLRVWRTPMALIRRSRTCVIQRFMATPSARHIRSIQKAAPISIRPPGHSLSGSAYTCIIFVTSCVQQASALVWRSCCRLSACCIAEESLRFAPVPGPAAPSASTLLHRTSLRLARSARGPPQSRPAHWQDRQAAGFQALKVKASSRAGITDLEGAHGAAIRRAGVTPAGYSPSSGEPTEGKGKAGGRSVEVKRKGTPIAMAGRHCSWQKNGRG